MDSAKNTTQRPSNPRTSASLLSAVTFVWTIDMFRKGYQRDLEMEDLFLPLEEHKSSNLGNQLEDNWNEEIKRASVGRKPSFLRAILCTFGLQLMGLGLVLVFAEIALKVAQPLFLARFLGYFTPGSSVTKGEAYYYASGIILCSLLHVLVINPYWMGMLHLGMKIKVACCSLIYRKVLKLNKSALEQTAVGQIVNIMSNDVERFHMFMIFIHYLWVGPVITVIISYFLWLEIGVSAFIGVAALLIFIPIQMFLGKKKSDFRQRTAECTDNRIRLMNEIVVGMQVIKMYAWEKAFSELVVKARKLEIKEIQAASFIQGIMLSFAIFHNRLAIFCSILAYVFTGNIINASIVYVVTSYFTLLRQMMSDLFPMAISFGAEVLISIKRMQELLCYDEVSKTSIEGGYNVGFVSDSEDDVTKIIPLEMLQNHDSNNIAVTIRNGSAKWNFEVTDNTLNDINIQFKMGKLVAVIGTVGAGKSSLLQLILKELPLQSGNLSINGKISYASQKPWLFDESIRQNILFGSPFDEMRYKEVINVCALKTDFEQLPFGDKTLVGDRGVILSGGQRARINLARAVYKEADIYLLDDPLSAVDTHVGKHIFEACIKEFLRGKTCILVTHQLQYIYSVDHIVFIINGSVKGQGTYQEIQASNEDSFSRFLLNQTGEEEKMNEKAKRKTSFKSQSSYDGGKDYLEPEKCEETVQKGKIDAYVLKTYLTGGGSAFSVVFLLFMFVLTQFVANAGDYWLSYWVNLEEYVYHRTTSVTTTDEVIATRFPFFFSENVCVVGFTVLILATIVISLFRSFLFFFMCLRSSTRLHNKMFECLTRTVMRFFQTNPSGRILNRFTKDMGTVDEILSYTLLDILQIGLNLVGVVGLVVLVNVWLMLPTIVIVLAFYAVRQLYIKTSRSIKRLEGIARSPLFSHLNASLQGLTTIRAFKVENILQEEFDNHQDLHSSSFYMFLSATRAFGYVLDLICLLFIAAITLSFLIFDNEWLGGNVGLVITQAIGLTGIFQWGMRQSAELENNLTSVERILEYCDLEKEPSLDSTPDKKPAPTWPDEGKIEFSHVCLSYSSSLPYVLKDLNFLIHSKEKIGIVGRTGAGKSSLVTALFRLAEFKGTITIDNVNSKSIGLHDLRSKISIIPQEPVLFSGTVRKNLDPFDEFPDHVLWNALEEVELKEVVQDLSEGLQGKISEGGSNLSVGQRQLICLARAILRSNRILILDEATANVDPQTDILIQNTIRRNLSNCTVLTIAHRLNTVMDSDRIMLLDNGSIVEFDHPHKLLKNANGYLYKMVDETGRKTAESLRQIAEMNYKSMHTSAIS